MDRSWRDAAISGHHGKLTQLLADGAEIDSCDRYGQTALMLAARHGRADAVRLLIDEGADLDVTAKYSLSALMLAIVDGHEAVARRLIDAGADLSIVGSGVPGFAGKTAHDLALDHNLPKIAAEIVRRPAGSS